jgi:hypothetical protein
MKNYPKDYLGQLEKELDEECILDRDGRHPHEGKHFNHAQEIIKP